MITTKYWLPKNRFYELKHFCLQYPEWKSFLNKVKANVGKDIIHSEGQNYPGRPTEMLGIALGDISVKVSMMEEAAKETDSELWSYILRAVGYGDSYGRLKDIYHIPCSRERFNNLYRKFFWLLDKSQ